MWLEHINWYKWNTLTGCFKNGQLGCRKKCAYHISQRAPEKAGHCFVLWSSIPHPVGRQQAVVTGRSYLRRRRKSKAKGIPPPKAGAAKKIKAASLKQILKVIFPRIRDAIGYGRCPLFVMFSGKVLLLAGVTLAQTALSDRIASLQGSLFRSVFMKNTPGLLVVILCSLRKEFVQLMMENAILSLGASALKSTITYCVTKISLAWRQRLYGNLQSRYFHSEYGEVTCLLVTAICLLI